MARTSEERQVDREAQSNQKSPNANATKTHESQASEEIHHGAGRDQNDIDGPKMDTEEIIRSQDDRHPEKPVSRPGPVEEEDNCEEDEGVTVTGLHGSILTKLLFRGRSVDSVSNQCLKRALWTRISGAS